MRCSHLKAGMPPLQPQVPPLSPPTPPVWPPALPPRPLKLLRGKIFWGHLSVWKRSKRIWLARPLLSFCFHVVPSPFMHSLILMSIALLFRNHLGHLLWPKHWTWQQGEKLSLQRVGIIHNIVETFLCLSDTNLMFLRLILPTKHTLSYLSFK